MGLFESPYDTFDPGGNVWKRNQIGLLRGFFGIGACLAHTRDRGFSGIGTKRESRMDGFRVAEVPGSAMMALLALGRLGGWRQENTVR